MNQLSDIKETLRRKAREAGFGLFGVAPADLLEADRERLAAWFSSGNAAHMDYLGESALRTNPRRILPDAASVVVVGATYAREAYDLSARSGKAEGRIARFALGPDYHRILRARLESLSDFLRTILPAGSPLSCQVSVDTGPLLERAFARRAGLGFVGKNTCLIHPEYGSWFLLGALITSLPLPADNPIENQCGDCRRCLDACPTLALRDAFNLDCRRCLSYRTIETRNAMPTDLRPLLRDRLFGCDTCQEVCPFNRTPLPRRDPDLPGISLSTDTLAPGMRDASPPIPNEDPSTSDGTEPLSGFPASALLENLLQVSSNRSFQKAFGGSSLSRPARKGLIRDAALVAGNLGRADLADDLRRLAESPRESESIREAASWALAQMRRWVTPRDDS